MNKSRRQQLNQWKRMTAEWIEQGEAIKGELESICSDEEYYFDNMPENLQGSTRGTDSEEAIDNMNEAVSSIEEAIDNANSAIESIEEII